jgi:hypothetical protein
MSADIGAVRCADCGTAALVVDLRRSVIRPGAPVRLMAVCAHCGQLAWIER